MYIQLIIKLNIFLFLLTFFFFYLGSLLHNFRFFNFQQSHVLAKDRLLAGLWKPVQVLDGDPFLTRNVDMQVVITDISLL